MISAVRVVPRLRIIDDEKKKRGAALHGSSFDDSSRSSGAGPEHQLHAPTKRFLTGSALGALTDCV
jgi:hypothetical protein